MAESMNSWFIRAQAQIRALLELKGKSMSRGKLFEYAVLYHPRRTKEDVDADSWPKSTVIVEPTTVIGQEAEIPMIAARSIPVAYQDKLEDVEIVVRPF